MVVAQALLALLLCASAPAPAPASAPAEDERVLPAEDPPENALREIAARALAELTRADGPVGECHDDERGYSTIVRSQRSPRTASEEVIDAQTISATPRRRSADDLLRLVPGVLLSQHGAEGKGSQLFMRGFDAAHGTDVEVTLAGIPVNELSNIHGQGYLDLNFIIPEVVRRIEVQKGPYQRLGGEPDVRVRPAPWVELRTDLTLVHARFVESRAPVPGAPPVLWTTSGYLFHRAGVRAGARLVVLGPRPLPQGARASGYALLDLSAGYRVGRLQLDLQVDNVLNRRWKEGEYNYASWFNRDDPRSSIPALHFAAGPPLTVRLGATLWL